ncbi:hypothetical protein CFOL_v3_04322 [Cephalotus follicularis]|uniref:CCHC-type domain-containing protein n=1 Tax=Cephalotus follicularis TaxID=3775 RepID=A0A1Q3AYS9_CEPFO|nr:hypothetical protein CFOL_v3_04322 [Cephalotus follicularis]
MNKVEVSLFELLNILRDTKIHFPKSKPAMHLTHTSQNKTKGKNAFAKGKGKGKQARHKAVKPYARPQEDALASRVAPAVADIAYTSTEPPPKGPCFYCGIAGHWKRNYKKFLFYIGKPQGKGETSIFMIQINMSIDKSYLTSWILDTGCSSYIWVNVQDLQGSRTLAKREVDLKVNKR